MEISTTKIRFSGKIDTFEVIFHVTFKGQLNELMTNFEKKSPVNCQKQI